jgi:hypothetical protein
VKKPTMNGRIMGKAYQIALLLRIRKGARRPATATALKFAATATALNSPLPANDQQPVTTLTAVHAERIDVARRL